MKVETKELLCIAGEWVCETAIGYAGGILAREYILPKCIAKGEKVFALGGVYAAGWLIGRRFAKEFYKFCDQTFDMDLYDQIYDK